jgi:hypothetical protein
LQYGIDVELLSKLQNLPVLERVEIAPLDDTAVRVSDNLRDLAPRIIAQPSAIVLPDIFDALASPKVPTSVPARSYRPHLRV